MLIVVSYLIFFQAVLSLPAIFLLLFPFLAIDKTYPREAGFYSLFNKNFDTLTIFVVVDVDDFAGHSAVDEFGQLGLIEALDLR